MAAAYALISALLFGAGDFFGGLASRRTPVLVVVAASHVIGLCLIVAVAPLMAELFTVEDFLLGGLGGMFGMLGITCLYHCLGRGPMAVVAPITAVGSAAFPVLWGVGFGDHLSPLNILGILVGLVAILLVSRSPGHVGRVPAGLVLEAMLAGAGFGGFLIVLDATQSTTTPWPLVAARLVSVTLAVLLVLRSGRSPIPRRSDGAGTAILAAGVFDMTANLAYLMAVNRGLLSLVAVLSALYPATTVGLARIVLDERMSRTQVVGMIGAVGAVACIAGG